MTRAWIRRAWPLISAVIVVLSWNALFDRAIGTGVSDYVRAATASADAGHYRLVNDWMGPVKREAFWKASAGATEILLLCLLPLIASTKRGAGPRTPDV